MAPSQEPLHATAPEPVLVSSPPSTAREGRPTCDLDVSVVMLQGESTPDPSGRSLIRPSTTPAQAQHRGQPLSGPLLVYSRKNKLAQAQAGPGNVSKPVGPPTATEALLEGLCLSPKASLLGPRPVATAPCRRRRELPADFTPRRSARLGAKDDGTNKGPFHRAQTVLLKRLGIVSQEESISAAALDEYLQLFSKPLAPHHIKAVVALFDPDGAAFNEPPAMGFSAFTLPEVEPGST